MRIKKYLPSPNKQGAFSLLWRIKKLLGIDRKNLVIQVAKKEKPKRILEIGCRNGDLALKLLKLNYVSNNNYIPFQYNHRLVTFPNPMDKSVEMLYLKEWD